MIELVATKERDLEMKEVHARPGLGSATGNISETGVDLTSR